MITDDMDLVREYAKSRSEEAFAAIVKRHVNLVHSVAWRQCGDNHLAEEITQTVFLILAKKAGSLNSKTILAAWLCRTAQYCAADALKAQRRRQQREQEVHMESNPHQTQPEAEAWAEVAPLLDSAMLRLGDTDHTAIVLRFFEGKNFKEVGGALGISENSAKTRVFRALEKLRKNFLRRGVTLSAVALGAALSANAVQAAPSGLAAIVTISATKVAVSTTSATLIESITELMEWTKCKTTLVAVACVLLVAGTAAAMAQDDGPTPNPIKATARKALVHIHQMLGI